MRNILRGPNDSIILCNLWHITKRQQNPVRIELTNNCLQAELTSVTNTE